MRLRRTWLGCRVITIALVLIARLPFTSQSDIIFRVPEVLVRHAALPKSVGTGPANASSNNGSTSEQLKSEDGLVEVHYEEYFVEHDVSAVDAKKSAISLNLEDVPVTRPGCGTCTPREMQYCETRVLADHCCCEPRYFPEPFPWLPHTCYMGPARCRPMAHDCARYARLRDCCCYRKLVERWKEILSSAVQMRVSTGLGLLLTLVHFILPQ